MMWIFYIPYNYFYGLNRTVLENYVNRLYNSHMANAEKWEKLIFFTLPNSNLITFFSEKGGLLWLKSTKQMKLIFSYHFQ